MSSPNPLISDRFVDFVLHEVLRVEELCALPAYSGHSRETFDLVLASARRLAREALFPLYRAMDAEAPTLEDGRVRVHPKMKELFAKVVEQGFITPTLAEDVGGQMLPHAVASMAIAYLMAANLSVYGYIGLTTGAANLIATFGDEWLRTHFMPKMYAGEWTGTMALTEPHAGSSLADVRTRARRSSDGTFLLDGAKVFISGGDHDLTENIVHMVLARIEGAPAGIRGVSLFAVPRLRPEGGSLVPNDVHAAGLFHKMGWKALPSIALNLGDNGACRGWLVGAENKGISYMFQMMNEARIMVGLNAASTASVAYQESLEYARTRPQGRGLNTRDAQAPQVPIIEHADVRRMLLRQKCIVEGSLCLLATASRYADLASHAEGAEERKRAQQMLDLLTPVAKSFPAEKGFESNTLAVQIHGGYGYTSEYLPESWLRDQKLNTIHEGTTGIQAMDLLGRKVVADGGMALANLGSEMESAIAAARSAGVDAQWCDALAESLATVGSLTMHLGSLGLSGDREGMLRHASDYLDLFSTVVLAWQWLACATAAHAKVAGDAGESSDFYNGELSAARYWFATELPRVASLADRIRSGEGSFSEMRNEWF